MKIVTSFDRLIGYENMEKRLNKSKYKRVVETFVYRNIKEKERGVTLVF
jgi:hypothetical protein